MKKVFILFISLLYISTLKAQPAHDKTSIVLLEQAHKMGDAFINGRYAEFSKYTHPVIVTMMGGEGQLISEITRNFDQIKSEGVSFKSISYGVPSAMLLYEGQLQCTLPQMIEMKVQGGTVTANSVLIAVSMDNGSNWYFVDPTGNDITTMRKVIPTLSPDIVIPVSVDPGFEPDKPAKP